MAFIKQKSEKDMKWNAPQHEIITVWNTVQTGSKWSPASVSFENAAKDFNDKSSHGSELIIITKKQCVSRGAIGEFSKS